LLAGLMEFYMSDIYALQKIYSRGEYSLPNLLPFPPPNEV
jgi:hypothetical protein